MKSYKRTLTIVEKIYVAAECVGERDTGARDIKKMGKVAQHEQNVLLNDIKLIGNVAHVTM